MKLHQDQAGALNTVTAYEADFIEVNAQRYTGSLYFMPQSEIQSWTPVSVASLQSQDLASLLAAEPEIILLGTGARQQFARPAQLAPLIQAGIGYEIMSTPAACRTYNILMAEGRQVMAALMAIGQESIDAHRRW